MTLVRVLQVEVLQRLIWAGANLEAENTEPGTQPRASRSRLFLSGSEGRQKSRRFEAIGKLKRCQHPLNDLEKRSVRLEMHDQGLKEVDWRRRRSCED